MSLEMVELLFYFHELYEKIYGKNISEIKLNEFEKKLIEILEEYDYIIKIKESE